jgi:two-component system response regulator (stage 0 sporulation protein F)
MKRVLIVEDDLSVGAAIQMMLGREGYDSVLVPDAVAGMTAIKSLLFDLAIVDIFMPGTNGLATIAEFRLRVPAVPIVAMSGFRFRESMNPHLDFLRMATEAGAVASLRKPFAPRELMTAVCASLKASLPVFAS